MGRSARGKIAMTRICLAFGTTGLASIAWLAASTMAGASELSPLAGESIHLGAVNGTVYFTEEPDGYQVVTTLAAGEDSAPVRIVVTLQPGQRQIVSVPRGPGESALEVEISRSGDHLEVSRGRKLASLGN
jgi:hypothetical protein